MKKSSGVAGDGLIARFNGPWAHEKLSFLDEFMPPALKATERKRERYYVDLFAGPGKNLDESNLGEEFDGSALRALTVTAAGDPSVHFTHATLVNLNRPEYAALSRRIDRLSAQGALRTPRKNIEILNGNANQVVHRIMNSIDKRAFIFVMADIEAPRQLNWSTLQAIKSHGHTSVDAFVLFPLDMALNRMLSYRKRTVEESASVLTAFFGCEDWRPLVEGRITDAQSPALRQGVLKLYMERMRGLGWNSVRVVRDVNRTGDCGLYKMLFATNHQAGKNIADWSAAQPRKKGQLDLF